MPTIRKVIVLAALIVGGTAHAGPKQEAKAHIAKATKAHEAGKYEVALTELKAAYKLDAQPDLLYAIGQVYSKLGNCDEAEEHFRKFKTSVKDPQIAKVVDEAIDSCKPKAGKGDKVAKEEKEKPAKEKEEKEKPAKEKEEKEKPTKDDKEAITQTPPEEETPPVKEEEPKKPVRKPFAATTRESRQPEPEPEGRPFYKDVFGDLLVVGGAAAIAAGLVFYNGARSDLDGAELANTEAEYRDLVDSAQSKRRNAVILGSGGVVLIGAGVVHYMITGRRTETRRVGMVPAKGGGLITWTGRF